MNDTTAVTEDLKRALAAEEGGRRWLRRLAIAGGLVIAVGAGVLWRAKHRPPPPAKYTSAAGAVGDVRRAAAPPDQRGRAGERPRHQGARRLQLGRQEGRDPGRDRPDDLRDAG